MSRIGNMEAYAGGASKTLDEFMGDTTFVELVRKENEFVYELMRSNPRGVSKFLIASSFVLCSYFIF